MFLCSGPSIQNAYRGLNAALASTFTQIRCSFDKNICFSLEVLIINNDCGYASVYTFCVCLQF